MNVLIIDNYDSFTFNLYQYIGEILQTDLKHITNSDSGNALTANRVVVKRNNDITIDDVKASNFDRIIISPGPGSPEDAAYFGICDEVIRQLGSTTPILGVCLGMQGIAHVFGAKVVNANKPMHGKTSAIRHNNQGVFTELPQDIEIMRYHSLMVKADTLPDCLEVTSAVSNLDVADSDLDALVKSGEEIMGIRHKSYPIQGVQFHPESFATEGAKLMLKNFLLQI